MIKSIKSLLILLFLLTILPSAQAEEKISSLYYIKIGPNYTFDDSLIVLPSFGIGARFKKGLCGVDLSATLSSLLIENYASVKGLFLLYPLQKKNDQLYFGFGSGIGYRANWSHEYGQITLEGVLGYEFRHSNGLRTFIQLELSQPLIGIGNRIFDDSPNVALMGGIGF